MSNFHLVDLISQREAVKEHLSGLSEHEILGWLSARGNVEMIPKSEHLTKQVYLFKSNTGREAHIFFESDEIIFIGDHHTYE